MNNQLLLKLKDGNEIPVLGLGTWQLTGKTCIDVVRKALELGYRHIDTAEAYGNQSETGTAIKDFDRSKIFLTSKVWMSHLYYDDLIEACEKTLEELNTDYLDLYLIHWPNREIPLKETFRAFKKLMADGKIKSVGVSNFTIHHLEDALRAVKILITVNQVEFHPYLYQKDLLEFCKKNGIVVTAYSPLGRGNLLQDETIKNIAKKYNKTIAQICLRWGLQKGVVVIPKSSSESHLKENLDIFSWKISEEYMGRIDLLNKSIRVVNPEFSEFDY